MAEFERLCGEFSRGDNVGLLRRAEKEPLKLKIASQKQSIFKMNSLYQMRKRINAQVAMRRIGDVIVLGPGRYPAR